MDGGRLVHDASPRLSPGPATRQSLASGASYLTPEQIKTAGYLVSTFSVFLLAIPAAQTAAAHPWLAVCLGGGIVLSILGMALRWYSYRIEKQGRR
jgi:hypothetical protein